jgi:hypothetical protein
VKYFVELNIGVGLITRETIQKNTSDLSKALFKPEDASIITVWDGTYVYIQKSANYSFQKQTYSMHKHRSLLKMMMIVTTNGKFLIFLGHIFLY